MVAGARKCDLLAFSKRFFQFIEAGEAAGHGKNRFRLHAAMPLTFCDLRQFVDVLSPQ